MPTLSTEFVFSARVILGDIVTLGEVPGGVRRYVPILGGTVIGPEVSGTILPLGGDSQVVVSDTLIRVEARYFIKTDADVTISVVNRGLRRAEPDVMRRLSRGEIVSPKDYYFRTVPQFEAPPQSKWAWLNASIFAATAEREQGAAVIHVYRVT